LDRCGLFLGYELDPPTPSNKYGLFEDKEIQRFHHEILLDNGLTWQVTRRPLLVINPDRWGRLREVIERREAEHSLWGFKEPRACLFLEVWKRLLPEAKCLIVYRHFADSAYSLERRAASELFAGVRDPTIHRRFWQEPDLALRIWLSHNEALLAYAREHPDDVVVVSFGSLRRGFPLMQYLEERWELGLQPGSFSDVFDKTATSNRAGRPVLHDPEVGERLESTLQRLIELERITCDGGPRPAGVL
jgi:hypothetical protein